ncbi:MAG: PKD domain-containing protein, partial [Parvicellaceae bacterium]
MMVVKLKSFFLKLFVSSFCLLFSYSTFAQNVVMTNGATVNLCSGTFLDPGGTGTYPANSNYEFTICPNGSGLIQLDFTSFDVEGAWDFLTVYDGPSSASPTLGTYDNNVPLLGTVGATNGNASGCLTFVFSSDFTVNLNGWEATISCTTPCQNVQANLVSTTPAANANNEIKICQGDAVNFVGSGIYNQNGTNYTQTDATSTFEWDFGDGTTATGTNVSHNFANEGAYYVSLTVTDINGCANTNSLSQLVMVSTTPVFAGTFASPTTICLGEQSTLTGSVTPVNYQTSCVPSVAQPLELPDGTGVTYQTCVNLDCYNPGQTLNSITDFLGLCLEMEHSYMGDLQIELTCPTGQNVVLVSYPNNGNGSFLGIPVDNDFTPTIQGTPFTYCFTDNAPNGTWSASAPGLGVSLPAGDYTSEQPLSNLIGCELNGDWCISITDNLASDNGFIFSWGVDINPALISAALSFTPVVVNEQWQSDPSIVSTNGNAITVQPATSGVHSYTYEMTDDFGCTYDTTISITVLPANDPSCSTPCLMSGITATMTNCYNTPFLQYDMSGEVSFTDPPLTGQLIIQNCFGQQEVYNAPFTSPQTYSFTGLNQDGQLCSMTAFFTDDPTCTISTDIQAPPPITFFSSNCTVGGGAVDGTIEFTDPNNIGGTLVVSISDGTTTIDTIINPPFVSPQTWSVSGLDPSVSPYVVDYYFSNFPTCSQQQTINCGCSADAGTISVNQTGNGLNSYILCENDQITITSNNDFTNPDDLGPIGGFSYQPALVYLVYSCPPTVGIFPGLDPCFLTLVANPNSITQNNDGTTSIYDLYGGSATFPTQELYYAPITLYHYDPVLGNYIVNSNCWDLGDITQVVFLSPIVSTSTPNCQNASVDVVISGGYPELFGGDFTASNLQPSTATFVNSTTTNSGTISISGLQNGDMYSFDVVDDNGCPHTVSGGPFIGLPTADAGVADTICGSLSYSLSATPSFGAGLWSGPGTFSPSANDPLATVTVASAGVYTFTWTEDNTNGCISTADVIISLSNLAYVDNVVQSTCGNADGEISLNASGGVAPYQYSINNGLSFQNAGSFPNLFSGTYDIVIVDDLGCQISGQVVVTDQGGPVINAVIGVDETCFGICDGSLVINAAGATLFSIDNGLTFQPSNTFLGLCAGSYDIVVQDNNGCQAISQIIIDQPPVLNTNFLSIDPLCFGDCTGEIDFSVYGGTAPYQYSIDNGSTLSANNLFVNLCAGSYDLIVQDSNGCQTAPQNISIIEPPALNMILGVTNETCAGACDGMINSIPSGGTGPGTYAYSWSPNLGSSPLIANLCTGNYSLTVTDANGCITTADTVILGPQAVTIDNILTTDELCGGDCTGSITVNATGANQYSLDGVSFQASNSFSNLCAGNYTIYIQDLTGCSSTDTISILGPSPVLIQAFSDTIICVGGTAQLTAQCSGGSPGYSYTWDNGSPTQSISVSPTSDQIYCVSGVDQNGCASSQLCLTVTVNPDLSILAFSDQTICVGDSTGISSLASGGDGGPYTYTWDQGLGLGQNHTVAPSASTIYTVTASDGCETPDVSATVTITVSPIPSISFSGDTLSGCLPVTTIFNEINVPAGSQCFWNFGDGDVSTNCGPVSHTFNIPGCWDVSLSVTTPDGCTASFAQSQYVCVYEYPNAAFSYGPQPTTIQNTEISFTNLSTDASSYSWTFDNGIGTSSSSSENPNFTFPNESEGTYEVCLEAVNNYG